MGLMRMDPAEEMRVRAWMDENGLTVECSPLSDDDKQFRKEMAQHWGRWWNAYPWEEDLWARLKKQDAHRNLVAQRGWQG